MKVFSVILLAVCVACVYGDEATLDEGGMAEIGPVLAPNDPAFDDLEKMKAQYQPGSPEFEELVALSTSTTISDSAGLGTRITPKVKKVTQKAEDFGDSLTAEQLATDQTDDADDVDDDAMELATEDQLSSVHNRRARSHEEKFVGMGFDVLVSDTNNDNLECDNCRVVMKLMQRALAGVKPASLTESHVKNAFIRASNEIPSFIGSVFFIHKVEASLDEIVADLKKGTTPAALCDSAQLCDVKPRKSPFTPDSRCEMCELVMTVVDDQIEVRGATNAPSSSAVPVLNSACANLPTILRNECSAFLKHHGATLLQHLLSDMHPVRVCHEAKMCDGVTNSAVPHAAQDSSTKGVHSEERLAELANMDTMGIGLEVGQVKSEVISAKKKPVAVQKSKKEKKVVPEISDECLLCNLLLRFETVAKDAKATPQAMSKVCDGLPHDWTQKCAAYVKKHGATLLKTIPEYENKELVCRRIHRCGAAQ